MALISTVFFSVFKNVSGCSGNVFKVSRSNRAGNAIKLLLSDSTLIREEKVVSKSEEVIVKLFSLTSNKKLSSIGKVFALLITPPNFWSSFKSKALETMNFICNLLKIV